MTAFSKNLRKLREEKKISQKSAAASLSVSQALLSHYEKGIRECGLDFLSRAAKFYGVTTDFMLGLCDCAGGAPTDGGGTYSAAKLYKSLLIHAVSYIFDGMRDDERRETAVLSGKYLSLAVYRLCGVLYGGVHEDPANLAERCLIRELDYIIELSEAGAPLGEYNFDNAYLNNIIKNADL